MIRHIECKTESLLIKWIDNYVEVYRQFILETDLEDDSADIPLGDLINYVNNELDEDDLEWYGLMVKIELV